MYSVKVQFVLRYFCAGTQRRGLIASNHSQPQHWQGVFGHHCRENPGKICICVHVYMCVCVYVYICIFTYLMEINPLNPELNPICYLLAILGAHHFLHVSRIRVKLLTFRLLMSYKYGAPILDVSRSHTTTQHSR